MKAYWIGIPTGDARGHMTIKYIGEASPSELERYKSKMDMLGTVQKFPIESAGVGLIGRHSFNIADFPEPNKRLENVFDTFGLKSVATPHVTRMRVKNPTTTGPIEPMDTSLAEVVNLYENDGGNTKIIYSVKLSRRTPLTWLADTFGLSKYASNNMNKDAAFFVPAVEALAAGALGAYLADRNTQDVTTDPVYNNQMRQRNKIVGGLIGGVGGLIAGSSLRGLATRALAKRLSTAESLRARSIFDAERSIHRLRANSVNGGPFRSRSGTLLHGSKEVYQYGVAPNLNTMLGARSAQSAIAKEHERALSLTKNVPFGLGYLAAGPRFSRQTALYTGQLDPSKYKLRGDTRDYRRPDREYIMNNLFSGRASEHETKRRLKRILNYYGRE